MYVRKRKAVGTPVNKADDKERSGGTNFYRGGAAAANQRNNQNLHNVPFNYDNNSSWPSQGTQQSGSQRPPPFKSLLQGNPGTRENSAPDRRNAGFNMGRDNRSQTENMGRDYRAQSEKFGRDYRSQNDNRFNSSRGSYGEQQNRNSYDQRQNANRASYMKPEKRSGGMNYQDAVDSVLGPNFRYGNTPFANMLTIDDISRSNMGLTSQGSLSRRNDPYQSDRRDDPYQSDRRNDPYQSDRRNDPYQSDRRNDPYQSDRRNDPYQSERRNDPYQSERRNDPYQPDRRDDPYQSDRRDSYSDRRRDPSPDRRGHSYPDRRGDSYPERNLGGYSGRRGGEPSPERGNFGYQHDQRDNDYPDRRYESDRRGDTSYSDRGHTQYRDEKDGNSYRDRRDPDPYYPEKRGGGPYSDSKGSPYGDRRGNSPYSNQRSTGGPFRNQDRPGNSYHSDDRRMDPPREYVHSTRDAMASRGQRAVEGRSYEEVHKGRNQDISPSKGEQQAALGIFKKVLAKQQKSQPSSKLPVVIDVQSEDDGHSVELVAKKRKRIRNRNTKKKDNGLPNVPHFMEESELPQTKKPRISVLSRLGPRLGSEKPKVFARVGPKSASVGPKLANVASGKKGPVQEKKKLGVKARLSMPKEKNVDDLPKLTPEVCKKLGTKYKTLPVEMLSCTKCARKKFGHVNEYLKHQLGEVHKRADASFQNKCDALFKYLQCDNKLNIAYEYGPQMFELKHVIDCDICGSPSVDFCEFQTSQIVHDFVRPPNCCQKTNFKDRVHFENHILSLPHLQIFSNQFLKLKQKYVEEKEILELKKELYLSGAETIANEDGLPKRVHFQHASLGRWAAMYRLFGTVPMPREVSRLLEAFDDVTDSPYLSKPVKKIKTQDSRFYNPSDSTGIGKIIFETNFHCVVCGTMLENSENSLIDHCSTKLHYDNVVKERLRLREKASEEKEEGEGKVTRIVWDEIEESDASEASVDGESDTEDHENKKKQKQKLSLTGGKEGNAAVGESEEIENANSGKNAITKSETGLKENIIKTRRGLRNTISKTDQGKGEAKTIENTKTEESEQSEEVANDTVEETNNPEEEVDMDTDPYGDGPLLGIEEEQEDEYDVVDDADLETQNKKKTEQVVEDEAEQEVEDEAEQEVEDEMEQDYQDEAADNVEDEAEEDIDDEAEDIDDEAEDDVEDEAEEVADV